MIHVYTDVQVYTLIVHVQYTCTCIVSTPTCISCAHPCTLYMYMYMSCLEYGVSWVRVPPEAAHFFLGKSDCLGCAVLLCLVCLFDLACFFLPSHPSLKTCIKCTYMYCECTQSCWPNRGGSLTSENIVNLQ